MITKLIGIGAAGNKAAICAVKNNVVDMEDTLLINSTLKDIPYDYKGKVIEFSNSYGGCGKERKISYNLCKNSIMDGTISIEEFLHIGEDDEAELCIIVTSTEGGTGSGATPLLAKYIKETTGVKVHVFAFTGFEEDVRGMKNTIEFFQELQNNFTVECVRLPKFLKECNNNKLKAEIEADKLFCEKISVLMGTQIRDSEHNIDPTDLLKIATVEGFMVIETTRFDERIKNREQFRQAIIDMIDNSKSLDLDEPSQTKMAVIMNINKNSTDYIDYNDILVERFGMCFEKFEHIQDESDMPQFFSFISAGSKMPTVEIENIYNKYKASTERVNKTTDNFFDELKEKEFADDDSMFDIGSHQKTKPTKNRDSFFKTLEEPKRNVEKQPIPEVKQNTAPVHTERNMERFKDNSQIKTNGNSKFKNTKVKLASVEGEY